MKSLSHGAVEIIRKHRFATGIVLLVTVIAVFGSALGPWLRYDRQAILDGEWWRLISCHFVHLNWSHLGMNMAGFLLIWILFGRLLKTWEWLLVLLPACLMVALGLLAFDRNLLWYVGFSGVLHSIVVVACLFDLRNAHLDGKLILLAICIKLIYEQKFGPLPGSETTAGGKVVVDAHLYGAIAGVVLAPVIVYLRFLQSRSASPQ